MLELRRYIGFILGFGISLKLIKNLLDQRRCLDISHCHFYDFKISSTAKICQKKGTKKSRSGRFHHRQKNDRNDLILIQRKIGTKTSKENFTAPRSEKPCRQNSCQRAVQMEAVSSFEVGSRVSIVGAQIECGRLGFGNRVPMCIKIYYALFPTRQVEGVSEYCQIR
jgi:hypothetical protein